MTTAQPARRFDIYKFVISVPGIILVYSAMFVIFSLARLAGGNNPILVQVGPFTFRWYGVLITIGVIMAFYCTQYLAARRNEDPGHTWALLPILLVTGVVGARIWYVVNTWEKYKNHLFTFGDPINPGAFEVWRGGIAIQGAVVGGMIGALIYARFAKIKFLRWADFIMPGVVVAQAMGRWGNFMNNEAYGGKTDLPWGLKIPCEYRSHIGTPGVVETGCQLPDFPPDTLFHPTFFYESVWNFAVFITLLYMIMYPKRVEKAIKVRLRDGDIFLAYFVLYSIGRFFIEGLRTDSLYLFAGVRTAQALSIAQILIAGFFLIYRHATRPTRDDEALSVKARRLAPATVGAADSAVEAADQEAVLDETEAVNEADEVEDINDETAADQAETEDIAEDAETVEDEPAVEAAPVLADTTAGEPIAEKLTQDEAEADKKKAE